MSELCHIIITEEPISQRHPKGLLNVSAPMKYKELCYEILGDALHVIDQTSEAAIFNPSRTLVIQMQKSGMVDVQAPLPPRHWCEMVLKQAHKIIDQFDDGDTKMRKAGYADCISAA